MAISQITDRYAKSLIDIGNSNGDLDKIEVDMAMIGKTLENRDLYLLIKSPVVSISKKLKVFNSIYQNRVSKTTFLFLELIIKKGREQVLPEVIQSFDRLLLDHKKLSLAEVISSTQLSEVQLEAIKSKIENSNLTQNKVKLVAKIDASLLSGLVIKIGDKLYDASLSNRLNQLKKEFSH